MTSTFKTVDDARAELRKALKRLKETEEMLISNRFLADQSVQYSTTMLEGLTSDCQEDSPRESEPIRESYESIGESNEDFSTELAHSIRASKQSYLQYLDHIGGRLFILGRLQEKVKKALASDSRERLLEVATEIRTGKGSEANLQRLISNSAYQDNVSIPCCKSRCLEAKKTLTMAQAKPTELSLPELLSRDVIKGKPGSLVCVHAIYSESGVFVACGKPNGSGSVRRYSSDDCLDESETLLGITGRVCFGIIDADCVRVEGREYPATDLKYPTSSTVPFDVGKRYDVYNKGNARFVLRVHVSGLCDLRRVSSEKDLNFTKVCEVSAKTPIAMDVSKDGQLLAVLEEGQDHVLFYRVGNNKPFITHKRSEPFRPRDVCFYSIDENEYLVIADCPNNALYFVDVCPKGCTPLAESRAVKHSSLYRPTALYASITGRLWVGGQGASISRVKKKSREAI